MLCVIYTLTSHPQGSECYLNLSENCAVVFTSCKILHTVTLGTVHILRLQTTLLVYPVLNTSHQIGLLGAKVCILVKIVNHSNRIKLLVKRYGSRAIDTKGTDIAVTSAEDLNEP